MVKTGCTRIFLAAIAMMCCLPQSALAFKNGHDLLRALSSDNPTLQFGSIMFVTGVYEAAQTIHDLGAEAKLYCVSDNLTREDVADTVRIWLRSRQPESDTLGDSASSLVIFALFDQFPCD